MHCATPEWPRARFVQLQTCWENLKNACTLIQIKVTLLKEAHGWRDRYQERFLPVFSWVEPICLNPRLSDLSLARPFPQALIQVTQPDSWQTSMPGGDANQPELQPDLDARTKAFPENTGQKALPVSPVVLPKAEAVKVAPSRKVWWWWGAAVLAGLIVMAAIYIQPWAEKPTVVTLELVTPGPLTRVLAVNGKVAALHSVDVRSTVSGRLQAIIANVGDTVKRGDLLAQIESNQQQAVVRQALAGLDAGLVGLAQAEASLARDRALGRNVSRAALEDAERSVQTAAQEVGRLTALFDQAQIALDNHSVTAPIAGTVVASEADVGQTVDPATVLFTLADLGQLIVETDVDEAYAVQIAVDQPVVLQIAGEAEVRTGQVSFVAPRVNEDSGALAVKLAFDQAIFAPVGLTVTANITVESQSAAISVPRAAVVTTGGTNAVFVLGGDVLQQREVIVVPWPAARLMVTQGLVAGDKIIVDATGLAEGQSVTVAAANAGD